MRLPGEAFLSREKGEIRAVAGSGRWAHADTSFYDTQKLFATHEGSVYRAQIVGEAQRGQLCYRLTGSRAFWDGYQPVEESQFIPGEINPSGGNVVMINADQRARLLADLQGGEVQRAAKAIEQLANLRPHQPDDEMAASMVTWIEVTERQLASNFSDAMEHWATLAAAPELIELLGMPDGVVRRIADAGLTGIGAPAEGEVARHLTHPNLETRERMLSLLGRIGTAQSLPALDAIKEQDADTKIRQAASFAAVQIRQRHGLESPMSSEMEDRRRKFERDREKWRADLDRKRASLATGKQPGSDDFRRRVEEQRRLADAHRKKFEAEMKARRPTRK